ncbi:unnamed protein product [Hermetia illucens]|uniref:Uncharacterized protein n=1 Tax=Hermetia illucens TaxID=343691 RepID=A0A7R8Z2Y5_HERIL|nr:unnamed protein product [Hermetia illucens]
MTMKSMKYSDCDTIMDSYNPVPPPLPRRVPPSRNIYAEPFAHEPQPHPSRIGISPEFQGSARIPNEANLIWAVVIFKQVAFTGNTFECGFVG